jgi:hypothetical protein
MARSAMLRLEAALARRETARRCGRQVGDRSRLAADVQSEPAARIGSALLELKHRSLRA